VIWKRYSPSLMSLVAVRWVVVRWVVMRGGGGVAKAMVEGS